MQRPRFPFRRLFVLSLALVVASARPAPAQEGAASPPPPDEQQMLDTLNMSEADLLMSAEDFRYHHEPFEMTVTALDNDAPNRFFDEFRLEFPTTHESPYPENNTAYGHWLKPVGKPSESLVFLLPYWGGTDLQVEYFLARQLVRRGHSACIMPLAYQFDRAPIIDGKRVRSGHYTVGSDLKRTRGSWIQSTQDVQRAMWWFEREHGYKHFGLWGISLGAHIAAIIYAVCPKFEAAVICMAGGNLHEMIWNDSVETREMKAELIEKGVTYEALKKGMTAFDPMTYAQEARDRKEGLFMVGGTKDEIIFPRNVQALADAFGGPELLWLPGTHVGTMILLMPRLPRVLDWVDRRLGTPQAAPGAGDAPTATPRGRDSAADEEF